jgi:hypothetical protein
MISIVSTRFTDETWRENNSYRLKSFDNLKCVYGSPQEMSPKILYDTLVFVVEMNNTINKIIGIGLIKNKPILNQYYKIHKDCNYNRFVYKSNYYIDRELLLRHNERLVHILDYILFKEKTHSKRGSGFTSIPEKVMKHKICQNVNLKKEIKNIFITIFQK